MKKYELMVILPGDMTEKEVDAQLGVIKEYITSNTGEIVEELKWGKRDLAYTIKKYDVAFYALFHFTMGDESKTNEITKELNIDQKVLRDMIVVVPEEYTLKGFVEEFERAEKELAQIIEERKSKKRGGKKEEKKAEKKEEKKEKSEDPEVVSDDDPDVAL